MEETQKENEKEFSSLREKFSELNNSLINNDQLKNFDKKFEFENFFLEKKEEKNNEKIYKEILNDLINFFIDILKNFEKKMLEKFNLEKKNKDLEIYLKDLNEKCDELNKYIDVLYKSIHSVLILTDTTKDKVNIIKCEPIPSYLKFINNAIN